MTALTAIRRKMKEEGYTQMDFARLLGSKSRASEILLGRRGLTMRAAYKLHKQWGVPAESLIVPFRRRRPRK